MGWNRSASAVWQGGNLQQGTGMLTTQSGVLRNTPYTFRSRFQNDPQTNPEELIAAAHAGCFNMALTLVLQTAGVMAVYLNTMATVTLDQVGPGFAITGIYLEVRAKIPGLAPQQFAALAHEAKINCPVSKLMNAPVTLNAILEP
jgi:osmotically inducible protein OsmC